MADDLLIRISGDPSGFQAAVKQVQDGLGQLQTALKQQAAVNQQAGNTFTAALKQGIDAMQRERSELGYLTSASKLYGEEIAKQKLAWLQAAQGADDYKLRLQSLNMELGLANDKLKMMGENSPTSGLGRLGQMFNSVAEGPIGGFTSKILGALNPLNLFHSQVMRLVEVMGLWRIFEAGSRFISNFASQIGELPVTMERFQRSWTYTFGMNDPSVRGIADPSQRYAAATSISRDLAAWSAQYSYNLPYTRQNMLQAISSLSMADLSAGGVKHYLPVLADLASTAGVGFGGQPVDLATAAYAVQGAMHGMTRMLRYDLKINPDELKKYGYDETNPDMLLPALEAYTKATHRAGAAKDMARNTFFGAKSSFEDRWQNLALDIGGYPAFGPQAGDLRQNSPFAAARDALVKLNDYWDSHQDQLNKIGAFISETIGQGMKDAGKALLAFGDGLKSSGLAQMFGDSFMNLAKALSDPTFIKNVQGLAHTFGGVVGSYAQNVGTAASNVAGGVGDFWKALGPGGQQVVAGIPKAVGVGYNVVSQFVKGDLGALGHQLNGFGSLLFHGDVKSFLGESGAMLSSATKPFGTAYDTIMDFAGHNTHGAGAHAVNSFITGAGDVAGHINSWLFGDEATTGHSLTPGGHLAHRGRTRLDMVTHTPGTRGFIGQVGDFFGGVGQGIGNAWGATGHWLQGVPGAVGGFFGGVGHGIQQGIGAVGNWFGGVGHGIQQGVTGALSAAGNWLGGVGHGIQQGAGAAWNAISGAGQWLYGHNRFIQSSVDTIGSTFNQGVSNAKLVAGAGLHFGKEAWDQIVSNATTAWKAITDGASAVGTFIGHVWDGISSAAAAVWATIQSAAGRLWSGITDAASKAWNAISGAAATAWQHITDAVGKAWKAIGDAVGPVWKNITDTIGKVWSTIVKDATDIGTKVMHALSDAITAGADWVKKAMKQAWDNALAILGFHDLGGGGNSNKPGAGHHASGGLMSAGGFSWVGEQGPELVYLPGGAQVYNAQQSTTMAAGLGAGGGMAGGGGTVINISGVGLMDILTLIDLYTAGGERQSDLTARRAGGTRRFVG